jgi:hypothetical protein
VSRTAVLLLPAAALAAVLSVGIPGRAARGDDAPAAAAPTAKPTPDTAAAIRRGVEFLVKNQNADGSWGTPASNLWDIYAPPPGSQYAFQVASTALALSGLLEAAKDEPGAATAIRRATDWLVKNHTISRRITVDTLYNVWAHAYALEAFTRLLAREKDADRRAVFTQAANEAIDLLARFKFVEGGWGYYDFDLGAKAPGPGSTTFTTATVLLALESAQDQGIEVPGRLWKPALHMLKLLRKPDNAFPYSYDHRYWPQGGINKVKGSLARTPACLLALEAWGEPVPPEKFTKALDDLETEGHFLRIARKYPIPHETWYQNSGYFCFYGYYYASAILERFAPEVRAKYQDQIAGHMVPLQEKDGSWWDYQLFNYHKYYGTGYMLLTLARCVR